MSVTEVPERVVRWFDDLQQDRWWLSHPVGTIRKYADDRGTALAGIVTFQLFLGMLPLLVVALTVLGRVLEGSDDLREAAVESALGQFPVLGSRLREDVSSLSVDGVWLAITVVGLLWTAAGIYTGLQLALNQVWNVEGVNRQGFVSRQVRAIVLFVLIVGAAVGTALVRGELIFGLEPSPLTDVASAVAGAALASVLLLGVFRLAVSPSVPLSRLVPAAVLAGLFWELLQLVGTSLVSDRLASAEDLYGGIGFVVVLLLWINLLARSAVLANEWAVVSWEGLWPRRIAQPPLTRADRQVLERLAGNERRRPEETVDISFAESEDADSGRVSGRVDEACGGRGAAQKLGKPQQRDP